MQQRPQRRLLLLLGVLFVAFSTALGCCYLIPAVLLVISVSGCRFMSVLLLLVDPQQEHLSCSGKVVLAAAAAAAAESQSNSELDCGQHCCCPMCLGDGVQIALLCCVLSSNLCAFQPVCPLISRRPHTAAAAALHALSKLISAVVGEACLAGLTSWTVATERQRWFGAQAPW